MTVILAISFITFALLKLRVQSAKIVHKYSLYQNELDEFKTQFSYRKLKRILKEVEDKNIRKELLECLKKKRHAYYAFLLFIVLFMTNMLLVQMGINI